VAKKTQRPPFVFKAFLCESFVPLRLRGGGRGNFSQALSNKMFNHGGHSENLSIVFSFFLLFAVPAVPAVV
jgi:hypothetical protein